MSDIEVRVAEKNNINLLISDKVPVLWGKIFGDIENQADLIELLSSLSVSGTNLTFPTEDLTGFGIKSTLVAGENQSKGQIVYIKSDGKLWKAKADTDTTLPAFGLALDDAIANESIPYLLSGLCKNNAWNWTKGRILFLNPEISGGITQQDSTEFETGQIIQPIGIALSSTVIYFNPQLLYMEMGSSEAGSGESVWGAITGTLSDQTDLSMALSLKVDKVEGKDLSTEDYTTEEKNKLSDIEAGAEVNVNADWNASSGDAQILNKPSIPANLSDLSDDSSHRTVTDTEKTNWGTAYTNNHTHSNKSILDTVVSSNNNFPIKFTIDGAGSVISTGLQDANYIVPFDCEILESYLVSYIQGSIVVDIWKDSFANYPPTVADTITASAKPTLSNAKTANDATLTGWTKTLSKGDVLKINVDSCSSCKYVDLLLIAKKV